MPVLQNKIDFVAIITCKNANPNGDPLNGNMPRKTYKGYGEISDVCIKRKYVIVYSIWVNLFSYSQMIKMLTDLEV
jgi:CRISPR-associated protein, Csd2 family